MTTFELDRALRAAVQLEREIALLDRECDAVEGLSDEEIEAMAEWIAEEDAYALRARAERVWSTPSSPQAPAAPTDRD